MNKPAGKTMTAYRICADGKWKTVLIPGDESLISVSVTRDHIVRGRKNSNFVHPIALALKDCGFDWVSIARLDAVAETVDVVAYIKFPEKVARFIDRLWDGKQVKPFDFSAEIMSVLPL